MKPHSGLVGLS